MGTAREIESRGEALAASLLAMPEGAPVLLRCVDELRSLLGSDVTVACVFVGTEGGFRTEGLPTATAAGERLRRALRALDGPRTAWAGACPLAMGSPAPVVGHDEVRRALPPETAEGVRRSFIESGLGRHDVLRLLAAEEHAPLGCVVALRAYRFDVAERRAAARVTEALRRRMALERQLREPSLSDAGLAAAMEAIGAPAFVIRAGADVVHANALGRERLAAQRDATREALALAWAARPPAGAQVAPVRAPGVPDHALVVLRATCDDLEARARVLAVRWALTPRQSEVLAWVARGASNKETGVMLGCAESTVEQHVTALLHKSGCACRAQLVAEFWRSG